MHKEINKLNLFAFWKDGRDNLYLLYENELFTLNETEALKQHLIFFTVASSNVFFHQ